MTPEQQAACDALEKASQRYVEARAAVPKRWAERNAAALAASRAGVPWAASRAALRKAGESGSESTLTYALRKAAEAEQGQG